MKRELEGDCGRVWEGMQGWRRKGQSYESKVGDGSVGVVKQGKWRML